MALPVHRCCGISCTTINASESSHFLTRNRTRWVPATTHLEFLPERTTDFIFAVLGEEFGLFGILVLLVLYAFIIVRSLHIATQAQDTYGRLLAGSLAMTFFIYIIVNTGMVTGLLPVVGLPLPLISYGGTSMVTLMAGFGILMSIHTHRKLLPT